MVEGPWRWEQHFSRKRCYICTRRQQSKQTRSMDDFVAGDVPKTEVHRRWQQWRWCSCGLRSSRSWGRRVGRPVASRGDLFTDAYPSLSGSRNTAWPEFRPRYVLRTLQVQCRIFHRIRSKDLIKDCFSSRTLAIYTTGLNIIKLCILSIQCVCVSFVSIKIGGIGALLMWHTFLIWCFFRPCIIV